jgi:NitT/TauT family transport system permease protein
VTPLVLLRDPGIGGSAAAGFWAMVLAVWLGAGLCVVQLASQRPRGDGARRALNLAVPLLFGAVVFYLWEVLVRGFGVPPVLMPSPVPRRRSSYRRCDPRPGFRQPVRGVLIGYVIGCGAGLLVAIARSAFPSSVAACFRLAISFRHCRWSAWRRSW